MFDINDYKDLNSLQGGQYDRRVEHLRASGIQTSCIENAVKEAVANISQHQTRSFVIYGEPQSGKTEMMIALTAKLVDEGYKIIVHLLNDNVSLLEQNLRRFKSSRLAPAPVNFKDIIDRSVTIDDRPFIIFCKKNPSDLRKLIAKIGSRDGIVIVDDEADYASPNSQINKGKQSRINELIREILGTGGIYVGVTATPARLDLNNTFDNEHQKWVRFEPHKEYTGQETFFPLMGNKDFTLCLISDKAGDDPKYCREAFFRFLVNSAYLNLHSDINKTDLNGNYTFLIHTSGKKIDHKRDFEVMQKIFAVLANDQNANHEKYVKSIWEIAEKRYPQESKNITRFILGNILRNEIKVLNSDNDVLNKGTTPACPFTVIIGGNIISRGVTFDNLLSMFFTRDVKHKLQQDTYIQRARMFGARGKYLRFFELTIPSQLYADWQKCFVFHRLALKSIEAGRGAPVWLSNERISAVASSSIDQTNVTLDSGEMSYALFDYDALADSLNKITESNGDQISRISELRKLLGDSALPQYLFDFIAANVTDAKSQIMIHRSLSIAAMKDADQTKISRKKGFMGGANFTGHPEVAHHIRIHHNSRGRGRVFYKYVAGIMFLKNIKEELAHGKGA
ncbi:MAG: DNA helicase [Candidatus Angelobacter sp. Gp1-AA117]|nr:MAG: DNA helicase [Candidatus Angelobacter sp. Gp1-AA117]